jgi:hypothetical protein
VRKYAKYGKKVLEKLWLLKKEIALQSPKKQRNNPSH